MTVYTSFYRGEIRGEAVSISLYPPKNWKGKHLPLFAPTPELLKWWKASAQDAEAEFEYERRFREVLQSRQQLIDLWVRKQQQASADVTLLCSLEDWGFLPQLHRPCGSLSGVRP
ncbi:DUF488 domain-containing protein [Nostoc sp. UIC 10630]|uniref:DUF488 domain-containing protein n=1 Tax=Nostoc sp. UIC 10630 TaxID=2100146 RepID=UPI0013D2B2CA|nr:DUF488 domain-containing protein [Nostoc sp. UIC 10630]NEU83625.1 DUF488 domain-containing protein [Nostoc sp. UIC 10630]